MKILLFDMDGVLLRAHAYRRALSETVGLVGKALGYRKAGLTEEDIDIFEAVGVTSEWESSAICSALMLKEVWQLYPNASIPSSPPLPQLPTHHLKLPHFQAFFSSQEMAEEPGEVARVRAQRALISGENGYTEDQIEKLFTILRGAHNILESLTHRLFQELVLGSRIFNESYGLEPSFNVDGYLQSEDRPTLIPVMHNRLMEWLKNPDHHTAIFTLRPSTPPGEYFDTPEAEIGLKVVGLEGLPVVGHGGIAWLADKQQVNIESLIKPSPAHVLAAIRRSLGDSLEQALLVSSDFVLEGKNDGRWQALNRAVIHVFEDSVTGFRSAQSAQKVLSEAGVEIDLHLLGVSDRPAKQRALQAGGATEVFEDLNVALNAVFEKG